MSNCKGFSNPHLQYITSSDDSEKPKTSLCVRDIAEDLYWMPVVFEWQTTRHDCVNDVTKYVQEYVQKPLLVNAIQSFIVQKGSHFWTWSNSAVISCGPRLQHQNSRNSWPRCPDVFKQLWKGEMLHYGKHAPPEQVWDLYQTSNLNWAHLCIKVLDFSV